MRGEVVARLGKASKAFGCIWSAIFQSRQLSVAIKREVYHVMVLSALLYGAETWTVKADSLRRMRGFHNRCIRSMLGVSRLQQWKQRITSRELAETIGMTESMTEILRRHWLRWLGCVARMDDSRMPKQLLFGELVRPRPRHGTRRRDLALSDVQAADLGSIWYEVAQDREQWAGICRQCHTSENRSGESCAANTSNPTNTESSYLCPCGRSFQRQGDLTRHSRFCDGSHHQCHRQLVSNFDCPCGRTLCQ